MPRKFKQADYDDDDDGYGDDDYDDYYDDEDHHHNNNNTPTTTTTSMPPGSISTTFQFQPTTSAVEETVEEGFWSCAVCTFENPSDALACDICDTPHEFLQAPVESAKPLKEKATNDVPKIQRVSLLAKALFKPMAAAESLLSDTTSVLHHKPWDQVSDSSSSLSSKIVPFKFDTPSPDEKKAAALGQKKPPTRVAQSSDHVLVNARTSMARAGASTVRNTAVAKRSTSASLPLDTEEASGSSSQVGNRSSSSATIEVAEKLKELTLESYTPETWMLQDSSVDSKQLLHLIVVGHVDAGKSTLMGRVLYLLGRVTQKEMHKNEKESKQQGKGSFAYAFVLDEGAEERARGVTMTVAVAHFETPKLRVVLLDAPGHKDFVPNMISGASQADAAILVVDASIGAFEAGLEGGGQTREHAQVVRSLGVEQLIVAVNKVDTVGFSKERFDVIKSTLQPLLKQCGFKDGSVSWIPVSAADGVNLTTRTTEPALKTWYPGPCLLELVDSLEPPTRLISKPLRLVIADVMKTRALGPCAFGGKLESGAIQTGTKVRVMPSGEVATVKSIERQGLHLAVARAGEGVDVGLNGIDPGMLAPGGVVCHPDYPVPVATRFQVQLLTLDIRIPILKGSQVILHVHHARQPATVEQLVSLLDSKKGTVLKQRPRHLTANQSAIVEIVPDEGVCIEKYTDFRALGRVALREGGKTIAVGIVTMILDRK